MRQVRTPQDWQARERLLPPAPGVPRSTGGHPYATRRRRDSRRVLRLAVLCAIWLALLAWPAPQIAQFLATRFANPALGLIGRSVGTLPGGVETFVSTTGPHQYWQVGMAATSDDSQATGMRASIETRVPEAVSQNTTDYFWVGSYLADGSFIQVGYYVPWYDNAHAGWFYCAFTASGHKGPCAYGPLGSAGVDTTRHTYTLETATTGSAHDPVWQAELDGAQIGQFTWTAADTGSNAPAIYAESSGFAKHDGSSQLGPVDFVSGLEVRTADAIQYARATHALAMYSAPNICPPYGVALDGHGGVRIGSGLACPDRWSELW